MDIKNNIKNFQDYLSDKSCTLVAVSKTKPASVIEKAYNEGLRVFGENKVQELVEKAERLPKDIEWHMIGHLQRNKVKHIAPFVTLIHAVDSLKLLKEINKQAKKNERIIKCLFQIHIAEEESKFGLFKDELLDILHSDELANMQHVEIKGLMGMATFTEDENQVRKEFKGLKKLFDEVNNMATPPQVQMEELSMGMSGDYKIAVEEGSTLIRVGSAIFGARQ